MWALRSQRYGGLAKRYVKNPWGVVRCLDPLSAQALSFPTQLHYENWLLHYARRDVVAIDASPPPLEYLRQGRRRKLHFDLLLRLSTGVREVQLVVREPSARMQARCEEARVVAAEFGFIFVPRHRETIRANTILLANLAFLRQLSATHADKLSAEHLDALLTTINLRGPMTRNGLFATPLAARLSEPQRLDGALFRLYATRRIQLNIHEVFYGGETQIEPF